MQLAFYKSSQQLAVFLNDKETSRLDPSGTGGFRAEVTPTALPGTFKISIVPDDNGNKIRELASGWNTIAWTSKSTRQSGVDLLSPRSQAEPSVGSLAWGPNGELCCEICYRGVSSSLPALVPSASTPTQNVINSTDDLGAVLAQMKAQGIKGRVTAITVDVL